MSSKGETIRLTAAIASILNSYPFSVGLLRELLQNSDDAKASQQVFVLDYQYHPKDSLRVAGLVDTQGPALLAFNDGVFVDEDWEAVKTIYESSKATDTSKIGKYGIGFRSCYHITDNPQILSGTTLGIFDPHHTFSAGFLTVDMGADPNPYPDQLSGFRFFKEKFDTEKGFCGTVIRLPLRTVAGADSSLIKPKAVTSSEIRQLFDDFISDEIGISLLFLSNLSSIEVHEISSKGDRRLLSMAQIVKDTDSHVGDADAGSTTYKCKIVVSHTDKNPVTKSWRLLHTSRSQDVFASELRKEFQGDVSEVLKTHKLEANVALAMPLSPDDISYKVGRLFTYLPLPLRTGFPCHVHGLFALTTDRQHLRNADETGLRSSDLVLVEWNNILFKKFIPAAWASLLGILLEADGVTDVFSLWPTALSLSESGNNPPWSSLPCHLLRAVSDRELSVWPTIGNQIPFSALQSMFVASDEEDVVLETLGKVGLKITRPPEHIRTLMSQAGIKHTTLSPDTAHDAMLSLVSELSSLHSSAGDIDCILIYLVSTGNPWNLIDLPLVRLTNDSYGTLTHPSGRVHTLMTQQECEVFGHLDDLSIPLHQLPPTAADLISAKGPGVVNVSPLTWPLILEYLERFFSQHGLALHVPSQSRLPINCIQWLSLFWSWLNEGPFRKDMYISTRALHIVPTSRNTLASLDDGLFSQLRDRDAGLHNGLEALGLSFLHQDFPPSSHQALTRLDVIKDPYIIHHILDSVHGLPDQIERNDAVELLCHFQQFFARSCEKMGPFTASQRRKLRGLPVYPHLDVQPDNAEAIPRIARLSEENRIISVISMRLIPLVPNTIFLDDYHAFLEYLQPDTTANERLDTTGVLSLAIAHLAEQPKHLKCAFVEYIMDHHGSTSHDLLKKLRHTDFVVLNDGFSVSRPHDIFDPQCETAILLQDLPEDRRLPAFVDDFDRRVITALKALGFLRDQLTDDIVKECIAHIVKGAAFEDFSRRLLHLMINYNCSTLQLDLRADWLPTKDGLRSAQECHHPDAHSQHLYDKVLPRLDIPNLPPSLSRALRWDAPITLAVVCQQFEYVVQVSAEHDFERLVCILQELGSRYDELVQNDMIDNLRDFSSGRFWIPISKDCITTTSHALLPSPSYVPLPGFYAVPSVLCENSPMYDFLTAMGCTTRPSMDVLVGELHALSRRPMTSNAIQTAILMLKSLADAGFQDDARGRILIPTDLNEFLPLDKLFYNDIGIRAHLANLPINHALAHPELDRALANRLRLPFLGMSQHKPLDEDEPEMGELLINRIRNVLRQYSLDQAFGEFVSNAVDAGATSFEVLVDEKTFDCSSILSPTMDQFQRQPALLFHNNGIFTEKDWKGIRDIGSGGKEGNRDSIGQFGLGALCMYHFTEMPMVLSGDRMMFLDPSKMYLAFAERAYVVLLLSKIRSLYGDHVAPFDGLFGFSSAADFYDGTLFRLPLRSSPCKSPLYADSLTIGDISDLLTGHYWDIASEAMLFTQLSNLRARHRQASGNISEYWSIQAERDNSVNDDNIMSQGIKIITRDFRGITTTNEWRLVSQQHPHSDLPTTFYPLVNKHRLRDPVKTRLAANLSRPSTKHKLFATFPLPISTSLPIHLSASFILAEDRRSIRFDGNGLANLESRYNRWLLSDLAPPLYVHLLYCLLRNHNFVKDPRWWWCWPTASASQEPMTNALVDSFYDRMSESKKPICQTEAGEILPSGETVLVTNQHTPEAKVVLELSPHKVIQLPVEIQSILKDRIPRITPNFLRQVICCNAQDFISAFERDHSIPLIEGVVRFLLEDESGESLVINLPLLPLADGSLAVLTLYDGADTRFFEWKSCKRSSTLFPLKAFLEPNFKSQTLLDRRIFNVSSLTAASVRDLVMNHISETPRQDSVPAAEQAWIRTFWDAYDSMNIGFDEIDHIKDFPLVRTLQDDVYVSMEKCLHNDIFLAYSTPEWLVTTLQQFGTLIVDIACCPSPALKFIQSSPKEKKSRGDFHSALLFLESISSSPLAACFSRLDRVQHRQFAQWARRHVDDTPQDLLPIIRNLPIWPTLGRDYTLLSATLSARMVPSIIPSDMPFIKDRSVLLRHDFALEKTLRVVPLNFREFYDHLDLPDALVERDYRNYRYLLDILIRNHLHPSGDVLVPSSSGVMVKASALYARDVPIFLQVFTIRQPLNLIHHNFQDFEQRLVPFGLRNRRTFESFEACARAIHEDINGDDSLEHASYLFQWYSEDLPIDILHRQSYWRQLDRLCFIPRDSVRRRSLGFSLSTTYCREFPEIVAPNEVLLPKYEAIGWTQRALPLIPPSDRLTMANAGFGVPSVKEVIDHLLILATKVAIDHPNNSALLDDLTQTYDRLEFEAQQDNPSEDFGQLANLKDIELFLNVDDPAASEWKWQCANRLLIDSSDGFHEIDSEPASENGVDVVCKYLEPFKSLLLQAGVLNTKYPARTLAFKSPPESQLPWRLNLNELRRDCNLTDVVFRSKSGEEILAHRLMCLATGSEYFRGLFLGEFQESIQPTVENPVNVSADHSSTDCLNSVLDYIYEGKFPTSLQWNELCEVLRCAHYMQLQELFDMTQHLLISKVSWDNFQCLRQDAETTEAKMLYDYCDAFAQANFDLIERLES